MLQIYNHEHIKSSQKLSKLVVATLSIKMSGFTGVLYAIGKWRREKELEISLIRTTMYVKARGPVLKKLYILLYCRPRIGMVTIVLGMTGRCKSFSCCL